MKRILVVGFGRAGKDESAMMLSQITKIPYAGSTSWAAKELVAKRLRLHPQVAWETRHQRREEWKAICDDIRKHDQTKLVRLALETVNEEKSSGLLAGWSGIVAGCRDKVELFAAKEQKIFDSILWIERPGTPPDSTVTFTKDDCDEVIYNDAGLIHLHSKLFLWAEKRGLISGLYMSTTEDRFRD